MDDGSRSKYQSSIKNVIIIHRKWPEDRFNLKQTKYKDNMGGIERGGTSERDGF